VTVPIVPHRQNWLIYGVFGGTAPLAGHRPHRPSRVGDGRGTVQGTVRCAPTVPRLFGLPMRIPPCAAARGTVGTVDCATLRGRTLGEILHLDLQRTGQAPLGCGVYSLALAGLEGRYRRPADVGDLR
jgi:hypothetical protein